MDAGAGMNSQRANTAAPQLTSYLLGKWMNPLQAWKKIWDPNKCSWVLFAHGTCVVFADDANNVRERAVEIMRAYGPVHVGCEAGDFTIVPCCDNVGWIVDCHHPQVFTFVSRDELAEDNERETEIHAGFLGRSKRGRDARDLNVVHIHFSGGEDSGAA